MTKLQGAIEIWPHLNFDGKQPNTLVAFLFLTFVVNDLILFLFCCVLHLGADAVALVLQAL